MNKWLIQVVSRNDAAIDQEVVALSNLRFTWQNFGCIPTFKLMTNLENILESPDDTYVIRGGTKMLTLLDGVTSLSDIADYCTKEQLELSNAYLSRLKAGLFYDINAFDQRVYHKYDLPLVNDRAVFVPLNIPGSLRMKFDELKFIKPSRDLKSFTAGLLEPGQTVEEFIKLQQYQPGYTDEELLIAEPRNIYDEYRFFVIGDEVITGSQYRYNKQLKHAPLTDSAEHRKVIDIAKEYAKLYRPTPVFTMDIGRCDDNEYGIVEYNCFNASGLYQSDAEKLFRAVQEYVCCNVK